MSPTTAVVTILGLVAVNVAIWIVLRYRAAPRMLREAHRLLRKSYDDQGFYKTRITAFTRDGAFNAKQLFDASLAAGLDDPIEGELRKDAGESWAKLPVTALAAIRYSKLRRRPEDRRKIIEALCRGLLRFDDLLGEDTGWNDRGIAGLTDEDDEPEGGEGVGR